MVKTGFIAMIQIFRTCFFVYVAIFCAEVWADAQIHRDISNGFEVSYPSNWKKDTSGLYPLKLIRTPDHEKAQLASYAVTVSNARGTLSAFKKFLETDPSKFQEQIRQRFPDATLISHKETVVGGFPALQVVTRYTIANLDMRFPVEATQLFVIRGNQMYLIQLETMLPFNDRVQGEYRAIQSTFNFR